MTFEQLRAFLAVAELRSFTKAADSLYMSQPSVSQHIQGLERHFKIQLFARRGRAFELTAAGDALVGYATRIIGAATEAERTIADLSDNPHGRLRIGVTEALGTYLLPGIVGAFSKDHPQVRVSVRLKQRSELLQSLLNRELDMAFVDELPPPRYLSKLTSERVAEDEIVVVVAADHPWGQRREILATDLIGMPLAINQTTDSGRSLVLAQLAEQGVHEEALHIAFELDSAEAIKRLVLQGVGVGFVTSQSLPHEETMGALVSLTVKGVAFKRQLWALWPADKTVPSLLVSFLAFMRQSEEVSGPLAAASG